VRCWCCNVDSGINWQLSEQCRVACVGMRPTMSCSDREHQQTELVLHSVLQG